MKTKVWIMAVLIGAIALPTNIPAIAQISKSPSNVETLDSFEVAKKLAKEASSLIARGKYKEAVQVGRQAVRRLEDLFLENQNNSEIAEYYSETLGNLALINSLYKQYDEAESLYKKSLNISIPRKFSSAQRTLTNLGRMYERKGEDKRAEEIYLKAWNLAFQEVFPNLDKYPAVIKRPSEYYRNDYFIALDTCKKRTYKIETLEKGTMSVGIYNPDYVLASVFLGRLLERQKSYNVAKNYYLAALENQFSSCIFDPYKVLEIRSDLVRLSAKSGDTKMLSISLGTNSDENYRLTSIWFSGSTSRLSNLSPTFQGSTGIVDLSDSTSASTFHALQSSTDSEALRLALRTRLLRQGKSLDIETYSLQACHQKKEKLEIRQACDKLVEITTQLSNLTFRNLYVGSSEDSLLNYRSLNEQRLEFERNLRMKSASKSLNESVDVMAVQNEVPKNAVLVEILRYRPLKTRPSFQNWWAEWRYAAAILHPIGAPKWVDLGRTDEIDGSVAKLRDALADKVAAQQRNLTEVQQAARALDQQIMAKIRPLLGNAEHLLISADGELNLVPFEALRDETGQYLVDRYQFSYLTSGRDLLRIAESRKNLQKPSQKSVILADPYYGTSETQIAKGSNERSTRSTSNVDTLSFNQLKGTRAEGKAVKAEILPDARLLMGEAATETALKQIQSPKLLLIATHGFFLTDTDKFIAPPPVESGVGLEIATEKSQQQVLKIENPLLRSGLALAGVNQRNNKDRPAGGDDGILTALEVAGLDLRGTQLVVLSACETGLGEAKVGDGVYGLRRALVIAGAQSQVLSLWKVDDTATKDLMVNYFRKMVKENKGRHSALQEAKQEMLKNPKYQHPYYWASFIPSGDWTPLSK
ncbi:CHAT domain-containing tetratricopeptide repeat protein [Phormidesmis sp. 146-35]